MDPQAGELVQTEKLVQAESCDAAVQFEVREQSMEEQVAGPLRPWG